MKRVDLFVIDGQNDFCASGNEAPSGTNFFDSSGNPQRGALYVEGADKEGVLVAQMIDRLKDPNRGHKISKIHATLDSHHRNDGMHCCAWKDRDGNDAPPFTIVTHDDVKNQVYVPRFTVALWEGKAIQSYEWALRYTKALDSRGRNPLCLWPPHCQIGTVGQSVYKPLMDAYDNWCKATNGWINFVAKGATPFTEHYSAIIADVPDPQRKDTQLNSELVDDAAEADIIVWTGWAGSHCLKWTALDAGDKFGKGENEFLKKSVFMEDASAPVVSPDPAATALFADWRKQFLDEVVKRGAKVMKTTEFLNAA